MSFEIIISIVTAQVITYKAGNITLANQNQFSFRSINFAAWNLLIYSGAYYSSLSLTINPNTANFDGLYGAIYTGIGLVPSAYLTFFDSTSHYQVSGGNYANVNTTAAVGFIGVTYISLDEVSPAGATVQTIALNSFLYALQPDSNTGTGGLRYVNFKGTKNNLAVTFTFVVSSVVGVLNVVGNGIITPKSLETIITIANFPYTSTANSVRLNMAVGTASASVLAQTSVTHLTSGTGTSGVFFTLDHTASVGGAATPVTISAFVDGQGSASLQNDQLAAQVTAKYGGTAAFKLVSVTFPAGAANIVYDPTMGAGATPPTSGSRMILPSFLSIVILFYKLFF